MASCMRFAARKTQCLRILYINSVCNQTREIACISKFRPTNFDVIRKIFRNSNSWKSRIGGTGIVFAGIMSWLGFEEEEKEDPLIRVMKLGILNMQREEYDKAESILHLALKLAQERADPQAQRYVYDLLANNAYQKGDFPKAEKLFVEVMKELLSSGMSVNDNALVEISLKLASIYSKQNQKEKAEEGFRFCISTQEKKLSSIDLSNAESLTDVEKDTVVLWAMSVDWYANHLLLSGKYSSAEAYFEKALDVSEKVNGPTHPQTLVLMNDVGSVASLRKDFGKAVEYFEKAITRGTKSDTPHLPAFYCNLGATYLKKGDHKQATVSCSKALKLAQKLKNEEAENDAKECLKELQNIPKISAA